MAFYHLSECEWVAAVEPEQPEIKKNGSMRNDERKKKNEEKIVLKGNEIFSAQKKTGFFRFAVFLRLHLEASDFFGCHE